MAGRTTSSARVRPDTSGAPGDLFFEPLGRQQLRNVSEMLDLFAIRSEGSELPTDPVCRMRLSDSEGVGSINFAGRTYHFCSLECTRKFAADPGAYVAEG